jgi:hypothetical protein
MDRSDDNRGYRPRSLGSLLPKAARPVLGRHGLAGGGIVADWPSIVGAQLAQCCLPMRLQFPPGERAAGTLHLRVQGSLATELQHLEPVVLERINGYFGYRAVARLRIHQGPVPAPRRQRKALAPAPVDSPEIDAAVGAVDDSDLRLRLRRFGQAIKARKPL